MHNNGIRLKIRLIEGVNTNDVWDFAHSLPLSSALGLIVLIIELVVDVVPVSLVLATSNSFRGMG